MHISRYLPIALLALSVPARAADADPYLPSNADAVLIVNVKQVVESPLMAERQPLLQQTIKGLGDAHKILEELGVEPFKDIDRMTFGKPEGAGFNRMTLIVRGRFDPKRLSQKAEQLARDRTDDFKTHQAGGYKIYEAKVPPTTLPILPSTLFLALVSESVVVAAPTPEGAVEALERRDGKKKAEQKKEFTDRLARVDAKQSLSIISTGNLGQGTLAGITAITGGVTLGKDIRTDLVVGTKDADSAKDMAELIDELLNQAKALAALMPARDHQKQIALLVEVLGALKTEAQGSAVLIKGHVTQEAVEKTLK